MKKIGQIMEDLGFDANASDGSKAAFIKYLIKKSYGVEVQIPERYQEEIKKINLKISTKEDLQEEDQMEFSFEEYKIAK